MPPFIEWTDQRALYLLLRVYGRVYDLMRDGQNASFDCGPMIHETSIVCYHFFLHRRESGPRKVAWTHSHSASLGSLPLRAHHLPAGPIARSGKPAGSLVGGVMTSRKVLLCGEILEKMHFHLILEINLTFKIKIKHIK